MLQRLKTLVIDDEPNNLYSISELLNRSKKAQEILYVHSNVDNYRDALDLIKKTAFNITIIDYKLDGIDCFSLLELLDIKRLGIVAFTTTKGDYHYERQLAKLNLHPRQVIFPNCFSEVGVEDFVSDIMDAIGKKYSVQYLQRTIELSDSEIAFVKKIGDNVAYYFRKSIDEKVKMATSIIAKTLLDVEIELNSNMFVKCHKSYFVNLTSIIGHCKKDKNPGGWLLTNIIKDGKQVLISYTPNNEDTLNRFKKLTLSSKVKYRTLNLNDYLFLD